MFSYSQTIYNNMEPPNIYNAKRLFYIILANENCWIISPFSFVIVIGRKPVKL